MICKKCGNENNEENKYCSYCGSVLTAQADQAERKCVICGANLSLSDAFCGECGSKQSKVTAHTWINEDSPKRKLIRKPPDKLILFILLGICILAAGIAFIGNYLGWFDSGIGHGNGDSIEKQELADSGDNLYSSENNDHQSTNGPDKQESDVNAKEPHEKQIVHVYSSGSRATLVLSVWEQGEWSEVLSVPAYIGKNGISYSKTEGDRCTPAGTFNVLYYLAVDEYSDTKLNFRKVIPGDVWVCDTNSTKYNTIQSSSSSADWNQSLTENMYSKFTLGNSTACIMFDYNGDGVLPGKYKAGCDIFIDGVGPNGKLDNGYGDIKISSSDMQILLSYLDSEMNPIIVIE